MSYHSLPKYLKKKTHTHSSTLVWPISSIALLVNVHSCISPSKNQTKKIYIYPKFQVYSEALVHHITTPSRSGINGRPHLEVKVRWDGSMPVKCTCKFTCTEMFILLSRSAEREKRCLCASSDFPPTKYFPCVYSNLGNTEHKKIPPVTVTVIPAMQLCRPKQNVCAAHRAFCVCNVWVWVCGNILLVYKQCMGIHRFAQCMGALFFTYWITHRLLLALISMGLSQL